MKFRILFATVAVLATCSFDRAYAQSAGTRVYNGGVTENSGLFSADDMNSFASRGNLQSGTRLNQVATAAPMQGMISGGVTALELNQIAKHDVVLIIDKSGSMESEDCPAVGMPIGFGGSWNSSGSPSMQQMPPQMRQQMPNNGMGFMNSAMGRYAMNALGGMAGVNMAGMSLPGMQTPYGMQNSYAMPAQYGSSNSYAPGYKMLRGKPQSQAGLPGEISRWDWCREQTLDLARQTRNVLPEGMTVILFSTDTQTFRNVQLSQIPQIFADNRPKGSTNTDGALKQAFNDYFERRNANNGNVKPLLVAVITDGLPNNPKAVNQAILNASQKVTRPGEISVTFLQIGHDPDSFDLLQQTSSLPMVTCKPFDSLTHIGLTKALVDCVSQTR